MNLEILFHFQNLHTFSEFQNIYLSINSHFNTYFYPSAVDFDEEYSALFGGVLDDQSIYLELCIKAVLNLYKDLPNPPTSVSIVAHSMVKIQKEFFQIIILN